MGTTAKVSIRDYLSYEAPEGYRHELIEGEIVLSPEPKPLHEDICRNLVRELETALAGSGFLVRTRTNAILQADESMPSPDVFVIDKTRWANARDNDAYPEGSPQLPVEVHSPANRPGILRKKIGLYLKNGALAVWVVYPKSRTITVHEQSDLTTEGSSSLMGASWSDCLIKHSCEVCFDQIRSNHGLARIRGYLGGGNGWEGADTRMLHRQDPVPAL